MYLSFLGHVVSQLDVLDLEFQGEGVVIVSVEDARAGGLPKEAVAGGGANGVPKQVQVHTQTLG